MSYDWSAPAQSPNAPKMKAGGHEAVISRIVSTKQDGSEFFTKAGEPQIMLVFTNAQGEEATLFCILSDDPNKSWALRAVLHAIGAKVELLMQHGIKPEHFRNKEWAEKQLKGRKLRVDVGYRKNPNSPENPYMDVIPMRPAMTPEQIAAAGKPASAPAAAQAAPAAPPPPEVPTEDIPF